MKHDVNFKQSSQHITTNWTLLIGGDSVYYFHYLPFSYITHFYFPVYKNFSIIPVMSPLNVKHKIFLSTNLMKNEEIITIQLNFVKANFIETNNVLRQTETLVPNQVLFILTKIQLFKSKYLCRTFYVSKHILRSRSGVFFIKSNGYVKLLFLRFRTYQPRPWWLSFRWLWWGDCVTIEYM